VSFETDHVSGSSAVALAFLETLERWVNTDRSPSVAAYRVALLAWLREAQNVQPTMALVHQLAARALDVADASAAREDAITDARTSLLRSVAAEREDLATSERDAARTAATLVAERGPWIATLSASGLVHRALLETQSRGLAPQVLIGESRPRNEGRDLATALAAAEIPAWVVVDAALPLLVPAARMVWIGADAVTDRGVVNKIGSFALALAAREHSIPVYAIATRRKFLPSGTAALKILEMPAEEVWKDPPSGVRPRNVYFELVPLELFRGVVVEDSVLGPGEVRTVALERPLPPELGTA
jgi:translation initiation factor 2B subunit (eIF-2B alpha/beta/delta family)